MDHLLDIVGNLFQNSFSTKMRRAGFVGNERNVYLKKISET